MDKKELAQMEDGKEQRLPAVRMRTLEEIEQMPAEEVPEKRTQFAKVYSMGDKVYQAVLFGEPVHYQDKTTGQWRDIDNGMTAETLAGGKVGLTNRDNGLLKMHLAPSDAEWTVRLENEKGNTIGWKLLGNTLSQGKTKQLDVLAPQPVQAAAPKIMARTMALDAEKTAPVIRKAKEKLEGDAAYTEILPGIDMQCKMEGARFKDALVIKSRDVAGPMTFLVDAPGLRLELQADQQILVKDEDGEVAFVMPAPYAEDAEKDVGKVTVALKEVGGGRWHLTYALDLEWLKGAAYPVVLDPEVSANVFYANLICRNFVDSSMPNNTYRAAFGVLDQEMLDSPYNNQKKIAFTKYDASQLPSIDSSCTITNATIEVSATTGRVFLYEVFDDWNNTSLTYANRPRISEHAADFSDEYMSGNTVVVKLNATNLVRKWYEGAHYGFATNVKAPSPYFSAAGKLTGVPMLKITYTSFAGMENHIAYESHALNRAGVANVNLFNGNLVVQHTDTMCIGTRMPLSVTHTYNACNRESDGFAAGYGWMHSLQMKMEWQAFSNVNHYVMTDGDGTKHYFKWIDGLSFQDMSGLGRKLTTSYMGKLTIEDKGNNLLEFQSPASDPNGLQRHPMILKRIVSAQGNAITIDYSADGKVSTATDGAGRVTKFAYDGNGRLSSIHAPGYETDGVTFSYDAHGRLTSILHEDGTSSYYEYTENNLLHKMKYGQKQLIMTYGPTSKKVIQVEELGSGMAGNVRQYTYGDNTTKITDGTVENGKQLTYHFNDDGDVTSINDMMGYAVSQKYVNTQPLHHPQSVSKMQRSVINLLQNHGFEKNEAWILAGASYASDGAMYGARCLKFVNPANGTVQYAKQDVRIKKGQKYTLSFSAKCVGEMQLFVAYTYTNANGQAATVNGPQMQSDIETNYSKVAYTFSIPSDASSDMISIYIKAEYIKAGQATTWVDCVQLEEGDVANRYNLVQNGHFSHAAADGKPAEWTSNYGNTASDIVVPDIASSEKPKSLAGNVMRLFGEPLKIAGIYQDIVISGQKDEVFVFGGWAKGYSTPTKATAATDHFNIRILFFYNGSQIYGRNDEAVWNGEWSGWQMASAPAIAPAAYDKIRICVNYSKNMNHADFCGLFLHKEEYGWTYTYDERGNVLSVRDLSGYYRNAVYDGMNNLTRYQHLGKPNAYTHMEYGTTDDERKRHLVRKITSPLNKIQEFSYDEAGNQLEAKLSATGETKFIKSTKRYGGDMNHAWASYDSLNRSSIAHRDNETDLLRFTANDDGVKTMYEYDQGRRLTDAYIATKSKTYRSQYTYAEDGKLTEARHNTTSDSECDVTYRIAYDALGNQTTVKVGEQPLSTNVYTETGDKLLKRVEYGNGNKVHYDHDEFKRVEGIRFDGEASPRYSYAYDAAGEVAKVSDHLLGRTVRTEYDLCSRPMKSQERAGTAHVYTSELSYDECNRPKALKERVGESKAAFETGYAYDIEDHATEVQFGTAGKVSYTYDLLGRLTKHTLAGNTANTDCTYGYLDGGYGPGSTTGTIKTITYPTQALSYAYDRKGLITSTTRNGQKTTYVYDALNQLVRVNDQAQGKTHAYTYDRGGNILRKAEYAYTTARQLGTPLQTVLYAYGDANWRDKLTSYNGTAITYDAIGNPLNDGTWRYTWQNGRQLSQLARKGDTVTFSYNAAGLRVRKTSTTRGTTEYTLSGKRIVHQKRGATEMHFWYTGQGSPAMASYNGKYYYYVVNAQGDVLALLDKANNNAEVVSYAYDAWGKQVACTGSMAGTLGVENPFRYRGYVFDEETGLYYLRSRYYNPGWGRFLNADVYLGSVGSGLSHNAFGYCVNNAVCLCDPAGMNPALALLFTALKYLIVGGGAAVGFFGGRELGNALYETFTSSRSSLTKSSKFSKSDEIGKVSQGYVDALTRAYDMPDSENDDVNYWEAYIDKENRYVINYGNPLTFEQAQMRVALGGHDVIARSRFHAYTLATSINPQVDFFMGRKHHDPYGYAGSFQMPHYHVDEVSEREDRAHILFFE